MTFLRFVILRRSWAKSAHIKYKARSDTQQSTYYVVTMSLFSVTAQGQK